MSPKDISNVFNTLFSTTEYSSPTATITEIWYIGQVLEVINENDIKVYIPGIDNKTSPETIPNSKPMFSTLFHCVPEVHEFVKVLLKCPWDYQTERYYIGPINIKYYDAFKNDDIALINRTKVGICFHKNNDITMTCDFNKVREGSNTPKLSFKDNSELVELLSKEVIIESYNSKLSSGERYCVVYGERLMDFLLYLIQVLKTHSHGPNAPAVPDFHPMIDNWNKKINDGYLLNDKVKTR